MLPNAVAPEKVVIDPRGVAGVRKYTEVDKFLMEVEGTVPPAEDGAPPPAEDGAQAELPPTEAAEAQPVTESSSAAAEQPPVAPGAPEQALLPELPDPPAKRPAQHDTHGKRAKETDEDAPQADLAGDLLAFKHTGEENAAAVSLQARCARVHLLALYGGWVRVRCV